jgi:hypothetical protein
VYRDFATEVLRVRSVEVARSLNPALQTFAQWVEKNKNRFQL